MTYGTKKNEQQPRTVSKRTSPQKDRNTTRKNKTAEKKDPQQTLSLAIQKKETMAKATLFATPTPSSPSSTFEDDDLLTPEVLLQSHSKSKKVTDCETPNIPSKDNATLSILELLSKKDNLAKISKAVVQVQQQTSVAVSIEKQAPIHQVPSKNISPPSTPSKKGANCAGRFAGLSNSPAPKSLPLPAFYSLEQELNRGDLQPTRESSKEQQLQPPMPAFFPVMPITTPGVPIPTALPPRNLNHSPPSNPHLDHLSHQLRAMLNIAPVQP